MILHAPVISVASSEQWSIHYASFSAVNQELFEKHLYNQSSYYKNKDDSCYETKP